MLNPSFSFYSQSKELMYIPFILGGNLKHYIKKYIPLGKQDLIFYLSQIINLLGKMHSANKIYCNIVLENIFVKENGYLILNGLKRSIINDTK